MKAETERKKLEKKEMKGISKAFIGDSIGLAYLEYDSEKVPYKIDDKNHLIFTKIFDFEGQNKDDLYLKAKSFIVENYVGGELSEQVDDKESGRYVSKAVAKNIYVKQFISSSHIDLHYILQVDIKENRVRIIIKATKYRYRSPNSSDYLEDEYDLIIPDRYPINQENESYSKKFDIETHAKMISYCLNKFDEFEKYIESETSDDW